MCVGFSFFSPPLFYCCLFRRGPAAQGDLRDSSLLCGNVPQPLRSHAPTAGNGGAQHVGAVGEAWEGRSREGRRNNASNTGRGSLGPESGTRSNTQPQRGHRVTRASAAVPPSPEFAVNDSLAELERLVRHQHQQARACAPLPCVAPPNLVCMIEFLMGAHACVEDVQRYTYMRRSIYKSIHACAEAYTEVYMHAQKYIQKHIYTSIPRRTRAHTLAHATKDRLRYETARGSQED